MSEVARRFAMGPQRHGVALVTLSDTTKLKVDNQLCARGPLAYASRARLRLQDNGRYPTDDDLTVTTDIWTAAALTGIVAAHVEVDEPAGCYVDVRLFDGVSQYVYSGGAWVAAGALWNTAAEVATGIAAWTKRALGFVFRLRGTSTATPAVYGVDVIGEMTLRRASVDSRLPDAWHEDAILRTFARALLAGVECNRAHEVVTTSEPPVVEVVSYSNGIDEQPYDVTGVSEAWNLTLDPGMTASLAGSWNAVAKTWTAGAAVAKGSRLLLLLKYLPEFALGGDIDYEYAHLPVVAVEGIRSRTRVARSDAFRVGGEAAEVRVLPAPDEDDLEMELTVFAATEREVMATMDGVKSWIGNGRRLVSAATGFGFGARLLNNGSVSYGRRGSYRTASAVVELQGVVAYRKPSETRRTVQSVSASFEVDTRG